jgi:hypothetical protein
VLETSERPEPIELRWGQLIAAFWAIGWPAWLIGVAVIIVIVAYLPLDAVTEHPLPLVACMVVTYLGNQILWIPRITRKNYRYFWIGIMRGDTRVTRKLQWNEVWQIWWRTALAQLTFIITTNLVVALVVTRNETLAGIRLPLQLTWIFVAGPLGIRWALADRYEGFRLQAFHRARWAPVPGTAQ